jgi:hypothetical protein
LGWLWPCPKIIRPHWKGFPRANPLDYWATLSATKEKSFITLTPGEKIAKLFRPQFTNVHNKLERLSVASLSSLV